MIDLGKPISWEELTVFEALYLLQNNNGYIDGDNKTVVFTCKKKQNGS